MTDPTPEPHSRSPWAITSLVGSGRCEFPLPLSALRSPLGVTIATAFVLAIIVIGIGLFL